MNARKKALLEAAQVQKGSKWGLLEPVRPYGRAKMIRRVWKCRCDCGNLIFVPALELVSGSITNCGCVEAKSSKARNLKHGMTATPTYNTWSVMLQRCNNKRSEAYRLYGALGVSVCKRWEIFGNFLIDMGVRPTGKSLDRINPFGNYEPNNCRWATRAEQAMNTRRHFLAKTWRIESNGFVGPNIAFR